MSIPNDLSRVNGKHVNDGGRLAVANARRVNPDLECFFTSALTGEGMGQWFDFLRQRARQPVAPW